MLDVATTILGRHSPVIEPLVMALTVVRLGFDDFYLDISEELSKVKGKNFETHFNTFVIGVGEGAFDLLTLGYGRQVRQFEAQQEQDLQFLRNISDPVNYFNVTLRGIDENDTEVGTVDFTAGMYSGLGGFLTLKLNENGSFTVHLPDVPTESGIPTQVTRTFSFAHPVTDIVLGVGEVSFPVGAKNLPAIQSRRFQCN
jgi:hypothetical protein